MVLWFAVASAVIFSYTIFGLTGFGAAIILIPTLSFLMPIKLVIPLVVMLGFLASVTLSVKVRRFAVKRELLWMVPGMAVGVIVGTYFLVHLPSHWLLVALGVVILGFGLNGLRRDFPSRPVSPKLALPAGVIGGVMGGLFGTEGPIYVMYLSRRIPGKSELRATIATLFILSGATRIGSYAVGGLFRQPHIVLWVLALYPCVLLGIFLGNRLHHALAVHHVRLGVHLLLIMSGMSILWHSLLS